MPKLIRLLAAPFALMLSLAMLGCTLFPEQKTPTLANTTSAEQHERILWQMVQKQQWNKIAPLFSSTMLWAVDGRSLGRDEVVPYLQSLKLTDAAVRDVSVKPNGLDMTVAYTLEFSGASTGKACSGQREALSVWQQAKGGGWVMIAHSEQPKGGSCTAS